MKKKVFIAMAVAAAMAAMPVAAGAAGSSHDSSSSSSTTTSNSGAASNAGVASGATVVSSQPTVQVTESGAKVTVAGATKDTTGTTIGLVGESAGNGAVKSGDVTVAAETAGLPDAAVSTINALNSSASLSSVLPGLGLEAFAKVGGTRAIVAKNAAGQDAPTAVSMFVDKLPANATVTVVCFNNATGQWMTITNVTVDAATKTVNFTVPGSCTVQIAVK